MLSLLSVPGAERRNNHQGHQILSTNSLQKYSIWRLVRKNCICTVWLNGLISSSILFTSELVWLASLVSTFSITDQIN